MRCLCWRHARTPKDDRGAPTAVTSIYFGVYCAKTGGVYLVPIEDAALKRSAALRVFPPRNNQHNRVRFAADYEIAQVDCTVFATARLAEKPGASGPSA